ncbi:MAG TPA: hypothetical protein VF137_09485 [Candidatus Dormibacteraeota bacterium]
MPNTFTRVPDRPVPELPRWARVLLPAADLFMVAMVSRPPTGTLRTTWVTPATLQLCAVLGVVAPVIGVLLLFRGGVALAVGILLILFAAGCLSVALVGLAQRRS